MEFHFEIAGLHFLLTSPVPMELHPHLLPFYTAESSGPDVIRYTIQATNSRPAHGALVYKDFRAHVYSSPLGEIRLYTLWNPESDSGENVWLVPDGADAYSLWVPPGKLKLLAKRADFTNLLAMERVFLNNQRLLLHSSCVLWQDKAVVFSGASGVGKSTHAGLWHSVFGAEILNGDRTVVEYVPDGWTAHGSPFCGSSNICKRKSAPISGIFLLQQAPENQIQPVSPAVAFRELLKQTIINLWQPEQADRACGLLAQMAQQCPIWRLCCRADAEAAELARRTVFGQA